MDQFFSELENMATNAMKIELDEQGVQISHEDIKRWQHLFNLSSSQAREQIQEHRSNLGRSQISDDLWDIVQSTKEDEGHDRESYEYSLQHIIPDVSSGTPQPTNKSTSGSYILKLEGPLPTADMVREIAQLSETPEIAKGTGEAGEATFCKIDGMTRDRVVRWISEHHAGFRPTVVRLSKATKQLDSNSFGPFLGKDVTLPQHRLPDAQTQLLPTQNQYPVWYFFYGKLADAEVLTPLLDLPGPPAYEKACVRGGVIKTWCGKYNALVDNWDHDGSCVEGSAYLVNSREEEEILQFFETDKYEVVRCTIEKEDGVVDGLVFRFVGGIEELR